MAVQFPIVPMRALSGELPTDEQNWAYEIKWDGMRIVAFAGPDGVRLQSSNGRDVTSSFPDLAGLPAALGGRTAVLDGELIAADADGVPSFSRLQTRMHLVSPLDVAHRAALQPVSYQIFDLLALDSVDATGLPYVERRRLLSELIEPGPRWLVPAHRVGDGAALLDVVRARGMEGIMAKRLDSSYRPGRRSGAWIKIKIRTEQEFVVGGWLPGEGRRQGTLGSLLVGAHDGEGRLTYAGRVGSGFSEAELTRLGARLADLVSDTCPFAEPPPANQARDAHWVRPEMVVQVAFGEWTDDGRLRHPSYLGERSDVDPSAVGQEP